MLAQAERVRAAAPARSAMRTLRWIGYMKNGIKLSIAKPYGTV
jgi:hypothetical protein